MAGETLVFRRAGFSPALSLLMPTFSFVAPPLSLTAILQQHYNAPLPPVSLDTESHSFGGVLMPDYYPCGTARPVSCYALFK